MNYEQTNFKPNSTNELNNFNKQLLWILMASSAAPSWACPEGTRSLTVQEFGKTLGNGKGLGRERLAVPS
jgi:hypothetical protein